MVVTEVCDLATSYSGIQHCLEGACLQKTCQTNHRQGEVTYPKSMPVFPCFPVHAMLYIGVNITTSNRICYMEAWFKQYILE